MAGLKVIALISGGKDSFFSMLHCTSQGHEIVALANLHPAGDENDTDSFMYQTVGHNVIPLYAEAFELPLHRAPILGKNAVKLRDYAVQVVADGNDVDETESLMPLLKKVMLRHPEANAVSTGAILSSYQRTRVESVALRLGLTPLAYLWQYPYLSPYRQSSLLTDMAAAKQDSRIIKVSTGGLDERHLWLNVCDNKVARAMSRYGDVIEVGAVLGEGGEFETLAIDGPAPLWKSSIVVDDEDISVLPGDGGSATLSITKAKSLEKNTPSAEEDIKVRTPELLDTEFMQLRRRFGELKDGLSRHPKQLESRSSFATTQMVQHARSRPSAPSTTDHAAERIQHLYNVSWEPRTASDAQSRPRNITEETELLLDSVRAFNKTIEGNRAHDHHNPSYCRPSAIAFTTILLRSMYDFSAVNAIYSTLFNAPNPPARVTVACGECMPPEVNVMMSFLYHDVPTTQRDGLHVQSRSYWAPANIGPYSQALSVPVSESATRGDARVDEPDPQDIRGRIVYVAGQIPLVPATMQLVSDSFIEQAVLSLQHLWRIGRAMHVHLWANITVYIIASSHEKAQERAVIAGELWRSMHRREASAMDDEDGDEDVDIGDAHLYRSMGRTGLGKQDFDKVNRSPLPDWNRIQVEKTVDPSSREESISPPCAIVQVAELPRNAAIEWAGVGCIAGEDRKIRLVGDTVEVESLSITTEILNKHTSKSEGSTTEYYVKYGHENEDLDGMIVPCRAVFDGYGNEHVAMARRWQQCDERPAEKPTA